LVAVIVPREKPLWQFSPAFSLLELGERVLFYEEGLGATVSVRLRLPELLDNTRHKVIEVNGTNVAGTTPKLRISQKMQGHLPLILYKAGTGNDPRHTFILGLGSGESAHCMCLHDITKLDCVELAPAEIRAIPHFHEINGNILENPKFHLSLDDARNFLMTTTTEYDVIESDSIHPGISIATYTREYFEICKSRLSEQGIFSSWVPLYNVSEENFMMMVKTLHSVFPHVMVWYIPYYQSPYVLLMATKEKLRIDFALMQEEMSKPAIRDSLQQVGLEDPVTILSTFITDESMMSDYTASALINDDDHMYLPHNIPRQKVDREYTISRNMEILNQFSVPVMSYLENYEEVRPDLEQALARRIAIRDYLLDATAHFYAGDYAKAAEELEKALQVAPEDKHVRFTLRETRFALCFRRAKAYLAAGKYQEALNWYAKAVELSPTSATAHNGAGMVFFSIGAYDKALAAFTTAATHCSDCAKPRYHMALVYQKMGMLDEARAACETALRINPHMQSARSLQRSLGQ